MRPRPRERIAVQRCQDRRRELRRISAGRRSTRRAGRAGTTPAGGGRTAGSAARPRRTRRRATDLARAGTRAPPGSRSPGAAVRDSRPGRPRGRAPRRRSPPARIAAKRGVDAIAQTSGAVDPDPDDARRRSRAGRTSSRPGPNDENGRPVSSITSSARTMRRRLPGSMRAAATGSTTREPVVRAREARRASRSRRRARRATSRSLAGKREVVDDRAHVEAGAADEQRPLAARFDVGDRGARRRPACARTDHSSAGSATSTRWCGTAARSAARRLGGADVHAAVHLHRVERDDLDVARTRARPRAPAPTCPTRSGRRARDVASPRRRDRDADAAPARRPDPPRRARPAASAARRSVIAHVDELAAARVPTSAARSARACSGGCAPTTPPGPSSTALDEHFLDRADARLVLGAARCARRPPTSRCMRSCDDLGRARSRRPSSRLRCPGRGENTNVYAAS